MKRRYPSTLCSIFPLSYSLFSQYRLSN